MYILMYNIYDLMLKYFMITVIFIIIKQDRTSLYVPFQPSHVQDQ